MNLYCIANIGKGLGLSAKGDWISFRGSAQREESHEAGQITVIPPEKPSLELRVEDETPSGSEVVSEIQSVLETISWAPERWAQLTGKLQERLRQIELRKLGLLHIMKFYLPVEEMVIGLCHALHELRVERRRMKNELCALSAAVKATSTIPENTLIYALDGIEQIKNQKYKCRTIPEAIPEWLKSVFFGQAVEREEEASGRP